MLSYNMESIVKKLKTASDAYYNTGQPIMTDEEYDELRDKLEAMCPTHPFLTSVGATPRGSTVRLPFCMPSLQKIKPGTGTVEKFAGKSTTFVASDKLDGLSALWTSGSGSLYLRGDGEDGVEIKNYVQHIQGLVNTVRCVVRGEIITQGETRAWVNGVLHHSSPSPADAKKLHFVAYEVLEPAGLNRLAQFNFLEIHGFEIPWRAAIPSRDLTDSTLEALFRKRRQESKYATDGIVVGIDCVPQWQTLGTTSTLPKDCVAFKMVISDQCADTVVKQILWAPSYQGYIIPRIQIEPVQVKDVRIEFISGHNAKLLVEKRLGVGARIRIRRSGDVIPTVDAVLEGSDTIPFPSAYEWDATHVHICVPKDQAATAETLAVKLSHFASALSVPNLGPGLVKKLVEAGYTTPRMLMELSTEKWCDAIGKGNGVKIQKAFIEKVQGANEMTLMIASSLMPRGVGETKLTTLFQMEPDWKKWTTMTLVQMKADGWSEQSLRDFVGILHRYEKWRKDQFPMTVVPIGVVAPITTTKTNVNLFIVVTGFRSSEFEAACLQKGIVLLPSLTKQAQILVTAGSDTTSTKAKKAGDMGIRILERSAFEKEYLSSA